MKILLLCEGNARTRDSWSGVSQSVVEHLESRGHVVVTGDVDLYGFRRALAAAQTASLSRQRWWVRYHLSEAGFTARSDECERRISEAGPDVDVILQIGATFAVPASTPQPVVMYCDSSIELSRAGAGTGHSEASFLSAAEIADIRSREEGVYRRASRILSMSHRLRTSFIDDFGIAPDRLTTVHCGPNVDPARIEAHSEGRTHPPTILFVGRDFGRKGGALLTRAFRAVRAARPDARLLMIGSLPDVPPEPGVTFVPFLSRDTASGRAAMEEAYRSASIFCLPTRFEPFGTSFVEAMLYGLPCVGPAAWAVPEIVEDGVTGLTVAPEDAEALSRALLELVENPARAAEMGRAGRARVLAEFTWTKVVGRIADALEQELRVAQGARGRRPPPSQ